MKKFSKNSIIAIVAILTIFSAIGSPGVKLALAASPATVNLGTAGNFAILSKTGISTTGTTSVVGDIGVSPAEATYITGFDLILPAASAFSTSALVAGKVHAPGYADPTSVILTTAVLDMQTAYTDAMGRAPSVTELGAGNIGGLTLAPGVYKWGTGLAIPTDVTLSGNGNDIWIFQIAQNLNLSPAAKIVLTGGAKSSNIFWVVAGQTTIGTTAVFNGNILDQTAIVLNTGAELNGRALAQTAVTLDGNAVAAPASSAPIPVVPPATPSTQPSITVLNPNRGEVLIAGQNYTIRWTSSNIGDQVVFVNLLDSNNSLIRPISNAIANTGSYSWIVGSSLNDPTGATLPSGSYRIGIGTAELNSNAASGQGGTFTIATSTEPSITVLSPNGGEQITKGVPTQITWNSSGIGSQLVSISLVQQDIYGRSNVVRDIANINNAGSYTWIPQDVGTFRIIIMSGAKGNEINVMDSSDNLFSIVASTATPAVPAAPVDKNTPATPPASAFGQQVKAIAISLGQGHKNSQVTTLQQFLISQNKGPAARALAKVGATSYFGVLTRAALAEFQAKVNIKPALGNFGSITRAYLKAN